MAGDLDDPFAMMGSMGEEQGDKVTCARDEAHVPDDEEDVAGDLDDPFAVAMLGDMGAEQVHKRTLVCKGKSGRRPVI